MPGRRRTGPKKINYRSIVGEQGINLIQKVVLGMGYLWYPTGTVEAGIDGFIEIRDPITGDVTNHILQIQSKATKGPFLAETADTFEYICDDRDLDYWLQGNAPVLLIVSRPDTNEAYWVPIKSYFSDPAVRSTRRVVFQKDKSRFDSACATELVNLAVPLDVGIYLMPPPKQEMLLTNLLAIDSYAPKLYMAETTYRRRGEIWSQLKSMGLAAGSEWILRNKRMLSFYQLDEPPWDSVCDTGTMERFDTDEWALADDVDRRNEFVTLLHFALRECLWTAQVRFDTQLNHFYFWAPKNLKPRKITYQAVAQQATRTVFQSYASKTEPDKIAYYRHSAFEPKFNRVDSRWYLEITPTYHFTWNGYDLDHYYEGRLQGIKRLERNPAVIAQVLLWAHVLTPLPTLLQPAYPFLRFGRLLSFDVDFGIDDKTWQNVEDQEELQAIEAPDNQLRLF